MRQKRKSVLVWDTWNTEHIKKHGVTIREVEEAYRKSEISVDLGDYKKAIISKINNGRIIFIVISGKKQSDPYVVSARDAGIKERSI
jgi:uncharacterized DUF497 family protein